VGPMSTVDRFAFGKNWQSFAAIADEESISEVQRRLIKLFPNGELRGARILDVGCGSGLSMAGALRLGASQVGGVDIDPNSIEAARSLLSKFDLAKSWSVETANLLWLTPRSYDVVYSWGVLHHAGEMWRALARRAREGLRPNLNNLCLESDGDTWIGPHMSIPLIRA
jgi:2-polyprenyl-3-methyl-5-hydroxy-6-metoxy-1,4-benzoquinol methylase